MDIRILRSDIRIYDNIFCSERFTVNQSELQIRSLQNLSFQ